MKRRIAVYGTLLLGQHNHGRFGGDQKYLGALYTLPEYTLYDAGIPVVVHHGLTRIYMEVYEVSEQLLAKLDRFEGCHNDFYQRTPIRFTGGVLVDGYTQRPDQVGEDWEPVEEGDWGLYNAGRRLYEVEYGL